MKELPLKMRIYLISLYIFTLISLYFFYKANTFPMVLTSSVNIIFFAILTMLTESFTVPFGDLSFSTSFAIQLSSFILFGPIPAAVIMLIGFATRVVKNGDRYIHIFDTPWFKTFFNFCNLLLAFLYAAFAYKLCGGVFPTYNIEKSIIPIIVFCGVFFFINDLVTSILFSIISKKNVIYSFFSNIKLATLNILAMAPFGVLLAILFKSYHYIGVILFLFPIILARYTFSLYIKVKSQYIDTVDTLMNAMEARDKYTEGHARRVAEIVCMIARQLKYNEWKIERLNIASLLHDVGKIGVEDSILNKPGKLTDDEYDIIKKHPEIGYNIIKKIKELENISGIIKHHHERYDGKGYPEGKDYKELSIDVFILQLADSIDAMATDRPYRKAMDKEQIIEEVKKCTGSQFHPDVVDAYLKAVAKGQ